MKRKLLTVVAIFCLAVFGLLCTGKAAACEHGQKTKGDRHTMGEGHQGHDMTAASLGATNAFTKKPAVGTKAKCPVMGNEFTVTKDTQFSDHKGKFYAFCCPGCKTQFDTHPEQYLK